jgi:hypothetical protein
MLADGGRRCRIGKPSFRTLCGFRLKVFNSYGLGKMKTLENNQVKRRG